MTIESNSIILFYLMIITTLFVILTIVILSNNRIIKKGDETRKIKELLEETSRTKDYFEREKYIDNMREYLEREISELNKKLVSSEEKWRTVNHLVIDGQRNVELNYDKQLGTSYNFLKGFGIESASSIKEDKNYVFMLMPFHDDSFWTFEIVNEVSREFELICSRGDEKYENESSLLSNIVANILRAGLIVVNVDGRNPNVFYELGIAHALNKKTILIAENIDNVPFDIKSRNIVLYSSPVDLYENLQGVFRRTLING